MTVVSHPEQVTPDWLTRALQTAGFSGEVRDVQWQHIGAGQVGDNARFELDGTGNMPATVVGKFPSSDPTSRQTGVELQNYAREVFFYESLADSVDIHTPDVFAIEFDPATHDFVVLMEDLAPGVQISQLDSCSSDQAALALEELGRLHGPRWADASLSRTPLLAPQPVEPGVSLYGMLQEGFLARYSDRLDATQQKIVREVGAIDTRLSEYTGPQTLIHIDYRTDNMIFGGPRPLTVLDWQSINLGCAFNDVAYFLGTSLAPAQRAADERALLDVYLDVLRSYGVTLDADDAWRLLRQYAPAGLRMAVIASMIVGETERGNDMFMAMAQRSIAMAEDLDTLSLLD